MLPVRDWPSDPAEQRGYLARLCRQALARDSRLVAGVRLIAVRGGEGEPWSAAALRVDVARPEQVALGSRLIARTACAAFETMSLDEYDRRLALAVVTGTITVDDINSLVPRVAEKWTQCTRHWSRNGFTPVPCVVARLDFQSRTDDLIHVAGAIATRDEPPRYYASLARLIGDTCGFEEFNGAGDSRWPAFVFALWDSRASFGKMERRGLTVFVETRPEIVGVHLVGRFVPVSGDVQSVAQVATAVVEVRLIGAPRAAEIALIANGEVLDQVEETHGSRTAALLTDVSGGTFVRLTDPPLLPVAPQPDDFRARLTNGDAPKFESLDEDPAPPTFDTDIDGPRSTLGRLGADVVLHTAVPVERNAVLALMTPLDGCAGIGRAHVGDYTYYVGTLGAAKVVLTMSRTGSGLRDGALPTLMDAIAEFRPRAVIAVGIAFGGYTKDLRIADVLVSTRIIPYEVVRKQADGDLSRAQQPEAGRLLLNRFRGVIGWQFKRPDGHSCKEVEGPLLTGEKLVDDLGFKVDLFARYPDAIGGEMEAAGVYGAASARGIEWIIVKAICDWGDGTKSKSYQRVAAAAAASLARHVLTDPGVLNGLRPPGQAPGTGGADMVPTHAVDIRGSVVTQSTIIAGDVHYHDDAGADAVLTSVDELVANGLLDEALTSLKALEIRQWVGLSTAQKYRVRKLQGRALLMKEDEKGAAERFREAFEIAPADEKAQLLRALSEHLEGRSEVAHALAHPLKEKQATRTAATALWVRTAADGLAIETYFPRPWEGLPADIAVAVADRLLGSDRAADAERLIRDAVAAEANPEFWDCFGICILAVDKLATPHQTVDPERLQEAANYFKKALALIKGQCLPSRRVGMTLNLALIAATLGNRTDEWAALVAAEAIGTDSNLILARKGNWLLNEARYDDAVLALEQLVARGAEPEAALMLAYALYKRGSAGDAQRALDLLDSVLRAGPTEVDRRRDAADLALEVRLRTEGPGAARAAVDLVAEFLGPFRSGEWSVKLDLQRGDIERAAASALGLHERQREWSVAERRVLGTLLLRCKRNEEAFDVLAETAPRDSLHESTAALMRAAEATENLEFLVRLCGQLIAAGVDEAGVVDAQIAALARRGDTGKALDVAIAYLRDHDNPYIRLRRAMLGYSVGRSDLAEADPAKLPAPSEGLGAVATHVVDVLRASGNHLEAVRFAYANYRLNRADPDAWRAVIQSFIPTHGEVPLEEPDVIVKDAAVRYREGSGPPTWLIIDDNAPDASHHEYATSHPLVGAMLGKRVSETFEIRRATLPPRVFLIEAIRSKYVYLYQDCLNSFEPTFPGASGPLMFEVPEDPHEMVDTLRPILEARANRVDELLRIYSTTPACSLHMLAQPLGGTVYDVMQAVAQVADVDVKCSFDESEWTDALVDSVGASDVVIDGPAISTLLLLDGASVLGELEGRLSVAQGALDEVCTHRATAASKSPNGVMGTKGGRIFLEEISLAERDAYVARVDSLISMLRAKAQVFVERERNHLTPDEWDVWSKVGGAGTADAVHRCMRTAAALWTDDGAIAEFAKQKGVRAVWTQLVLTWAHRRRGMDARLLYDASARLVGWRFVRTNLSAEVFLQAAVISGWDASRWPMAQHLRVLEMAPWRARQLVLILGSALRLWWREAPSEHVATSLTIASLDRIVGRSDVELVCRGILEVLPLLFSLDVLNLDRARKVVLAWVRARS